MSTPQSNIFLCSDVLIDNTYRHTIYFENLLQQESYFDSKVLKRVTGYTYLRPSWSIKVGMSYAEARRVSYLFFTNPDSSKRWYYFINRIEYINDETTELFLEMDVIQTFLFDFDLKQCFIERETTRTDEVGDHTIDEGLEVGELIDQKVEDVESLKSLSTMMMVSEIGTSFASFPVEGSYYGGVYSALAIFGTDGAVQLGKINNALKNMNFDSIVTMWVYPTELLNLNKGEDEVFGQVTKDIPLQHVFTPYGETLDGYEPKNKKLLTYPFRLLHVTNNNGGAADFRFERMTGADGYTFKIYGSPFPDGGVTLFPANYNGAEAPREYGLTLTGFPTIAWTGDAYKIWLAQNQHSQAAQGAASGVQILGGVAAVIGGLATANPIAAVGGVATAVNGLTSVNAQLAQQRDLQAQPPQARGNQSASVNAVNGFMTFTFYEKCISKERAKILDDYFTMYGYKVNRIGTPSLKNRSRFTYIKTTDCVLRERQSTYTSITFDDRQKIANIFNNGITFWVDGDDIGEYTEPNELLN